MSDSNYIPPKVWQWTGEETDLNQPTSGARYEYTLPVGKHPLQLYSLATPNGQKVTILLEELLALGHQDAEYDAWLIKIGEGQQFGSGFVEVNPNSKIPALVDHSQNPPLRVFESGSILLYLAEKFKAFIPTDIAARTECLNWLFWQMGSAPYLGGGFGHFYAYAPVKIEYAVNRFAMETKRLLDVLDQHLAKNEYLAGSEYTIADIACFPWTMTHKAQGFTLDDYPNVKRWFAEVRARPQVQAGLAVGKMERKPMDEETRKNLFGQSAKEKLGKT